MASSNQSCWASCLGDCDQKISREHLVSECLFECDEVMVQGFKWCANEPKNIGLSSLVAKILCRKHNSDLSITDSAALRAFDVFRETIRLNQVRGKMKKPSLWNIKEFTIDGPMLERWFLKTLINLSFQGELPIGLGTQGAGIPAIEIVEVAFGLREFADGAGLYIVGRAGEQIDSMDRVNVVPMDDGERIAAGRFNFRGHTFFINLTPQKFDKFGESHLLYRNMTMNCTVSGRMSHRIFIRGW